MNKNFTIKSFNVDPALFSAIVALLVLGVIMVSSASITLADNTIGAPHFFLF